MSGWEIYWDTHGNPDAPDVNVEVIVLARNHEVMARLEAKTENSFNARYDQHKRTIGTLKEKGAQSL